MRSLLLDCDKVEDFVLQAIAVEVKSESKWKQLGELAMPSGKVLNTNSYLVRYLENENGQRQRCNSEILGCIFLRYKIIS